MHAKPMYHPANDFQPVAFIADTPAQVAKLNAALIKALDDPKLRQRLDATGLIAATPARRSPDYLREFINAETKKWAAPVKASGVNIE